MACEVTHIYETYKVIDYSRRTVSGIRSAKGKKTYIEVLSGKINFKVQNVAVLSICSWSSAELCCSIFFWQCVRPYYCNRSQESLIHRGLSGKEKLLEQSPFLEPVVKSSDQSTLSPWASWGLGTQASVLQWPRCTEEKETKRLGEGGREKKRQGCGNLARKRQLGSGGKNTITHK